MRLFHRRRQAEADGIVPRRPHAGVLRRERRALLKAREEALRDVGGLLVEMYRRGGFRDDLLAERAALVVGIDARLQEIEELLYARGRVPRCDCGAPVIRGARFCPSCGRPITVQASGSPMAIEATVVETGPQA
jgi:hypothetical protein